MMLNLDAIEARANAATPGPWEPSVEDSQLSTHSLEGRVITKDIGDSICDLVGYDREVLNERWREEPSADAYFIAHAREDVPELVAEVRKLRAALHSIVRLAGDMEEIARNPNESVYVRLSMDTFSKSIHDRIGAHIERDQS